MRRTLSISMDMQGGEPHMGLVENQTSLWQAVK